MVGKKSRKKINKKNLLCCLTFNIKNSLVCFNRCVWAQRQKSGTILTVSLIVTQVAILNRDAFTINNLKNIIIYAICARTTIFTYELSMRVMTLCILAQLIFLWDYIVQYQKKIWTATLNMVSLVSFLWFPFNVVIKLFNE